MAEVASRSEQLAKLRQIAQPAATPKTPPETAQASAAGVTGDELLRQQQANSAEREALVGGHRQAELTGNEPPIVDPSTIKVDDRSTKDADGVIRDENGDIIYGVYISNNEHMMQLALYDRDDRPIFVPFTNHTLVVRDEHLYKQIEDNMRRNAAYSSQIIRADYRSALMLLEMAARTQKEAAQIGAMGTPLVRAAESIRAANMAFFKQDILDGVAPGSSTRALTQG